MKKLNLVFVLTMVLALILSSTMLYASAAGNQRINDVGTPFELVSAVQDAYHCESATLTNQDDLAKIDFVWQEDEAQCFGYIVTPIATDRCNWKQMGYPTLRIHLKNLGPDFRFSFFTDASQEGITGNTIRINLLSTACIVYNADGSVNYDYTEEPAAVNIAIEEGFDGYIDVLISDDTDRFQFSEPVEGTTHDAWDNLKYLQFGIEKIDENETSLLFGDIYLLGEEEETTEPAETTEQPTESAPPTADPSTVTYVVLAVAAAGTMIFSKKR